MCANILYSLLSTVSSLIDDSTDFDVKHLFQSSDEENSDDNDYIRMEIQESVSQKS